MELHQLKYFLAVAETGGFTSGAEKCGITQPSLSQQIGKLEHELNTPLFHRLGRAVELTEEGQQLIPRAREILGAIEDIHTILTAASDSVTGPLRIGTVPTISQFMLPSIVKGFLVEFPDVDLVIHEDNRRQLIRQIADGEIDLALLSRIPDDSKISYQRLFEEDFLLVLPRNHRLMKRKRIRINDLAQERFVLLDQGAGLPNLILEFFRAHEIEPKIACRSSQLVTVQSMVSAGLGISFVPNMAAQADLEMSRACKSLYGAKPKRTVTMAWHGKRHLNGATLQFMQRIRHSIFILKGGK